MGKIHVLDRHVAELIAAGEVVERPSSVVKELVENAIDAGSTAITVEIKNGGIEYIRVSDNGCGIAREDVPKAFLRHATSKVKAENDLESIATLGFRGEALASICAVSHVEILTCSEGEALGTKYSISGGEEESLTDAGCPKGTTIIVRNIFYNVPARMKFLKKDVTEANAVANVLDKIALSHPEIAVTFIRDGKQTLHTAGDGKLLSSIYTVYGREFANGLIPVDYSLEGVAVRGYVSSPQNARPNRNMQNFFINGRFVKSRTAMAAIEEACKGSVMTGKFPACVLHISLSCQAVDVNVHPAKIEVRFIQERPVFDALYHAVKSALLSGDQPKQVSLKPRDMTRSARPSNPFEFEQTCKSKFASKQEPANPLHVNHQPSLKEAAPAALEKKEDCQPQISIPKTHAFQNYVADGVNPFDLYKGRLQVSQSFIPAADANTEKKAQTAQQPKPQPVVSKETDSAPEDGKKAFTEPFEGSSTKFIGEAFRTYIIMERGEDELVFIDKHAAHERILYEKLKAEKGAGAMQYLLEPITVALNKLEYDAALQNAKAFLEAGFEIEDFGTGNILVRSAPQYLEHSDIASIVTEMAGYLLEHKNDIYAEQMDWIYHNVACRAAVKAGNINHPQELIALADQLEANPALRYCPHGRPVRIVIKKREIEKQFGRM